MVDKWNEHLEEEKTVPRGMQIRTNFVTANFTQTYKFIQYYNFSANCPNYCSFWLVFPKHSSLMIRAEPYITNRHILLLSMLFFSHLVHFYSLWNILQFHCKNNDK